MIQTQTILKVADNSGAKTVKCIGFVGIKKKAYIGDCIIVSVRSLYPQKSSSLSSKLGSSGPNLVKKGQIFKALIIRTKKGITNRPYGHSLSFETNAVVLLNTQGDLAGSRIFGPITRELRSKNFRNLLACAGRTL